MNLKEEEHMEIVEQNLNITCVQSKSGHLVPVVDGVELHSTYNPIKEAFDQALYHSKLFDKNPNVLILGLGMGYHVHQIDFKIREFHKKYRIIVIEPNSKLYQMSKHSHILPENNVSVLHGDDIENYYNDIEFVDFLQRKPCVILHNQSFNLNETFFRRFLGFQKSHLLQNIMPTIHDNSIREKFGPIDRTKTLFQALEGIQEQNILDETDFLLLAYKHIIQPTESLP